MVIAWEYFKLLGEFLEAISTVGGINFVNIKILTIKYNITLLYPIG